MHPHLQQRKDSDSSKHCRVAAAVVMQMSHDSPQFFGVGSVGMLEETIFLFFYKVFMFCWWCTATRNWRHGGTRWGIQGPVVHFYCQDCCDNYITSWDNLETSFPSALKLVAVFPLWSLGKERIGVESNGGGAEHIIMYWYAAVTSKPFLKVPTVTASSTEATCRHLYKCITIH